MKSGARLREERVQDDKAPFLAPPIMTEDSDPKNENKHTNTMK